ncbi:MAG: sigma-70 family RNA polymerase sigma factor [Myxococcota bacterium]|nr:sigma-70 family RNA polymerase sigma factor [Myxococcota bacterium]
MGSATTDAELIAASRGGDAAAFGKLVERYQRAVHAVSYSATRDRTLSDDVAQDTFVTAWRQLGTLREVDRLPAWLCGIARNLARAERRRRGRELPLDGHDSITRYSPFDAVSDHEAEQLVAAALTRLPEQYREPMVLFYCEGQSVKAVAGALGISEAATHQRLSRGRQQLAEGMSGLVERTLGRQRPRRDLVTAVVAAIAMIGVASQVEASTTSSKGSTMFKKIGAALTIAGAVTGTALVVQGTRAQPAPVPSSPTAWSAAGPAVRVAEAASGSSGPRASRSAPGAARGANGPAGNVAPLACHTIARHLADLGVQAQPDIAHLTPEQIALDIQKLTAQVETACATQHWSIEYRTCIAAASEAYTVGVDCARFGPPENAPPATVQPQPRYTGTDFSCAAVGKHVVPLMQPDQAVLDKLDPDARKQRVAAIERARIVMPDQVEAACDQDSWSEARRRCMLAATVMSELADCGRAAGR